MLAKSEVDKDFRASKTVQAAAGVNPEVVSDPRACSTVGIILGVYSYVQPDMYEHSALRWQWMPLCGYMLLSDAVYIIYITPREAAESDIPFQRFVNSVNTNAAVYNPAVAIIPNGIKIAEVAV